MDMRNILSNFDAASSGKKVGTAGAAKNEMKAILESLQTVQECGMDMPAAPSAGEQVNMNVTLNARGVDAIAELVKLMGGAQATRMSEPVAVSAMHQGPEEPSMADLMRMASDEHEHDEEEGEVDEEWDNSPEESYGTTQDVVPAGNDLNRPKSSSPATAGGDNPLALKLKEELSARWKELSK